MRDLLKNGYKAKKRPSGHDISKKFSIDNGASTPPNLIAVANTESNGEYLRYCNEKGIEPHPARYPAAIPEFFIRMLTETGDRVVDPFAGSCVTGEVCERLERRWTCIELDEEYLRGAKGRFRSNRKMRVETEETYLPFSAPPAEYRKGDFYRVCRPGMLWNGHVSEPLASDGGQKRKSRRVDVK